MKHSVKDYLKHLDDMENWKGQQEERRLCLGIAETKLSRGADLSPVLMIDLRRICALDRIDSTKEFIYE
jgi:hypothetical protein